MLRDPERQRTYRNPVYAGYFADPFVLRWGDRYVAYGTGSVIDGLVFETLVSADLVTWERVGGALRPVLSEFGSTYWAPEVVEADGRFWLYYSVGHEDAGHQIRVAAASSPFGPFVDEGVNLTPHERFAIDPHPFRDDDGTWYLYYARDVLDGERVGTQIAADVLPTMTSAAGRPRQILAASADWQLYERNRWIYGGRYDWHTLEGPTVQRRGGAYYLMYSGGSWLGPGYAVAWARSDHPLGPWREPSGDARLLATEPGRVRGPGHNSIVTTRGGSDLIVYHAWDESATRRLMCIDPLTWDLDGPHTSGPSWQDRPVLD
jgi:arabinan endo-1,5-alpha-L-arabinosidase